MCVIVAKKKNKNMPSKETLQECFFANPHGAGFMYVIDNEVYIEKGFMKFDVFYNRLMELDSQIDLTKHAIVMHFRISTSGKIDKENCHPYPITQNKILLRTTFLKCKDIAFCHNGVIRDYAPLKKNSILNDTQIFAMNVLAPLKKHYHKFYKDKKYLRMLDVLAKSKLCFLDNKERIVCVGSFYNINGILYSNLNFKYRNHIRKLEKQYSCLQQKLNLLDY